MKRSYLGLLIMVLLAAVSCVQENLQEPSEASVPYSFIADFGSAEAKATLEPGVTSSKVKWTEGDEVTVFAGENTHKYSAASTAYSSELNFVAVLDGEVPTQAATYYAVHPYDDCARLLLGGGNFYYSSKRSDSRS